VDGSWFNFAAGRFQILSGTRARNRRLGNLRIAIRASLVSVQSLEARPGAWEVRMPVSPVPWHRGRDRAEHRRIAPGLPRVPGLLCNPSGQQRQAEGRRAFRLASGTNPSQTQSFT
jgi:hypothetical protein